MDKNELEFILDKINDLWLATSMDEETRSKLEQAVIEYANNNNIEL